jgi:hypothetical protein
MSAKLGYLVVLFLFIGTASTTSCPDESTCDAGVCCKAAQGFSCCPFDSGVCCDDGIYCCPPGMTCSLKEGICVSSFATTTNTSTRLTDIEQFGRIGEEILSQENDVSETVTDIVSLLSVSQVCPDKRHKCNKDATCCPTSSQEFGCCPYDRATCCSDDEHCCPHGSTCDVQTSNCERLALRMTSSFQKTPMTEVILMDNVYCPGGEQVCPEE